MQHAEMLKQMECIKEAKREAIECIKFARNTSIVSIPCDATQFLVYQTCIKRGSNRDGRR
jgi:hypothetical protein